MSHDTELPASQKPPRWLGILHLLTGLVICCAAFGIIPIEEHKLHAPRWVLFLCGLVFAMGGTMVLTYGVGGRMPHLFAAVVAASLGTIGLWVSLNGDPAQFSSNMPLSPQHTVSVARIVFGLGGAACLLIAVAIVVRSVARRS